MGGFPKIGAPFSGVPFKGFYSIWRAKGVPLFWEIPMCGGCCSDLKRTSLFIGRHIHAASWNRLPTAATLLKKVDFSRRCQALKFPDRGLRWGLGYVLSNPRALNPKP